MTTEDKSLEALAAALAAEKARADGLQTGYYERGRRITAIEAELGETRRKMEAAQREGLMLRAACQRAARDLASAAGSVS